MDELNVSTPFPKTPNFQNLTGNVYGRLTVIAYLGSKRSYWLCQCECGNTHRTRADSLKNGSTQSCGCLHKERVTTHGQTIGKRSGEYQSYTHAKERCENPKHHAYARYGGRGIKFLFDSFDHFFKCLGRQPSPEHTVDRFPDKNGHYMDGNTRWATPKEQANNRESTIYLTLDGETKPLSEWAMTSGQAVSLLRDRITRQGWCARCTIHQPPRSRCLHK